MLHEGKRQHIRTTGSHLHLKHPTKPGLVTVPGRRKDVPRRAAWNITLDSPASGAKMKSMQQYTVIIEPAEDGTFSVYVPDLPGCVSSGRTREDAIEGIREAIQGHIQTLRELGQPVPPPRSQSQVVAA